MTPPDIAVEDIRTLVERVREATAALMQGDVRRYRALVNEAPDYTLMPPTGGPTRHGVEDDPATIEALEQFFRGMVTVTSTSSNSTRRGPRGPRRCRATARRSR